LCVQLCLRYGCGGRGWRYMPHLRLACSSCNLYPSRFRMCRLKSDDATVVAVRFSMLPDGTTPRKVLHQHYAPCCWPSCFSLNGSCWSVPYRRHSRDAQASVSASSCGKYTTHCTDQESNYCLLSISPIGDHFLREIMSGSGAAKILNAREKGHSIPVCKFIRVSSLQHCDKYPGVPSHSSRAVLWTR